MINVFLFYLCRSSLTVERLPRNEHKKKNSFSLENIYRSSPVAKSKNLGVEFKSVWNELKKKIRIAQWCISRFRRDFCTFLNIYQPANAFWRNSFLVKSVFIRHRNNLDSPQNFSITSSAPPPYFSRYCTDISGSRDKNLKNLLKGGIIRCNRINICWTRVNRHSIATKSF